MGNLKAESAEQCTQISVQEKAVLSRARKYLSRN